jgi:hypothetical protein
MKIILRPEIELDIETTEYSDTTFVDTITNGISLMSDANQFVIRSNLTQDPAMSGEIPVTIRKGKYIGEEISIVYWANHDGYNNSPDPETLVDQSLKFTVVDGGKFETGTDVPTYRAFMVMGFHYENMLVRMQDMFVRELNVVIFMKWVGKSWMISSFTNHGYLTSSNLDKKLYTVVLYDATES